MFVIDGRYIQDHFPGIGRYTFNLIDALARIAPDEKFSVLFNPALKNTRYDLNALVRYPNVHLHRVDALTFSLREQWHLPGVIGGLRADVFHSPYYLKPYLTRGSSVVTLFDLIPTLFPPEVPNVAARLAFRYLAALAIRTSTRVIVPSEATRQDVVRLLHAPPEKIAVTPLAASADFKPVPETEIARVREKYALPKPYALYVGTNKPHKNLSVLFDAWARVEADAMLVIAGAWDVRYAGGRGSKGAGEQGSGGAGGQGREGERERGRRRDAGTLTRWRADALTGWHAGTPTRWHAGAIDDADLPGLYAGAEAFVFPSLYEGFGLPVVEAMSCGAPVVCSDIPVLREVAGDAALYFDPRDAAQLAPMLTRVLDDATLRADLRTRGLSRAAQFSWERAARETLEVYRETGKQGNK